MRKRTAWMCSLAASVGLILMSVPPARASTPGGGVLALSGTGVFPTFPCPLPEPNQPACVGNMTKTSVLSGTFAGNANGVPWTAVVTVPLVTFSNTPSMVFAYVDSLPPEPRCVEGLAAGTTSFNEAADVNGRAFGSYNDSAVPLAVVGVVGSFDFQWRRMGGALAFHVENFDMTLKVYSRGTILSVPALANAQGEGVAAFVPNVSMGQVPDCLPGPETDDLTATITGEIHVTATQ